MNKTFLSRLKELSMGRDLTPWLKLLEFSDGAVTNILKGGRPSAEMLEALQRHERISLRWLLEGRGPKYHVHNVLDKDEGIRTIAELLVDMNGCHAYCIESHGLNGKCIVLVGAEGYQRKTKGKDAPMTIHYDRVEVLGRYNGPQVMNTIYSAVHGGLVSRVFVKEVSVPQLMSLEQGDVGNLELLGWRDARKSGDGWLFGDMSEIAVPDMNEIKEAAKEYESSKGKSDLPSNVHQLHTLEIMHGEEGENAFLRRYRQLNPVQQEALLVIMEGLVNPD